jgi:hypothetical protein
MAAACWFIPCIHTGMFWEQPLVNAAEHFGRIQNPSAHGDVDFRLTWPYLQPSSSSLRLVNAIVPAMYIFLLYVIY